MHNVIIGTAGHVDHGKTCLIRALTGIDTDRLEEEKRRGITIELGFAYLDLPDGGRAGIIDVPGHEKFIRNMLAGAGGVDVALLVIAADEGVMPQTREHLGILSLLDIRRGCVAVTKTDMVDEEWLELVLEDIKNELEGSFLADAPIVPVSSYTGAGIGELRDLLFRLVAETAGKNLDKPFRLPVDRVFSMQGFGTVVTGTLIEGRLREGDEIMLYPSEQRTRARNVQVHAQPVAEAQAGQRVAVNLLKVKKEELARGTVLAAPESMRCTMMLDVELRLLKETGRSVKNGSRLHFYHGAEEKLCKAVLLGGVEELLPGESCYAQLRFEENVAAKAGDHYVVRFYSPIETIGGGLILDPCPRKHKRSSEEAVKKLELLHRGGGESQLEALLLAQSPYFTPLAAIRLQCALPEAGFDAALEALVQAGRAAALHDKIYLHADYLAQVEKKMRDYLEQYHAENPLRFGARREELRGRLLRHVEVSAAEALIDLAAARGAIEAPGGVCRLPGFAVQLSPKQEALKDALLAQYDQAGFSPPERTALQSAYAKDKDFPKVLDYLLDAGLLLPVDAEIFFSQTRMEEAMERFRALAREKGSVTLAEFRDAVGTSRKYALPLLEYWDKRGFTRKHGDARTLA